MKISNVSRFNNVKKWAVKSKNFIFENCGLIAIIIIPLTVAGYFLFSAYSNKQYEEFSKKLVVNDYPTPLCKSNNSQFRVYEQGSYDVAKKDVGWNVWWKDKGYSGATAFHVAKCEIKDSLK